MPPRNDDLACQLAVEHVTDYLEGTLGWRARREFERHLDHCPHCARYLEQMRVTVATMGRLELEPLADDIRGELVDLYKRHRDDCQA